MADFAGTGTGGAVAGGSAKVKFAATYTGREIDPGPDATRAKAWIDYEDIASVSEREFREAIASATPVEIVEGSFGYALNEIVEEPPDLSVFESRDCNDETGRLAHVPSNLLK